MIRTVHHLDQFTTPELARCHERAIVTPVAHVCVSRAVAGELAAGWGLTATVIPNGVEAGRFERAASAAPDAVAARARWREAIGEGPVVLAVGGIEPRKGTLDLVEAVRLLATRDRPVRLVIAGGETLFDYRDYRAAFDAASAAGGVEPLVLGPVDHDRLPALVAEADVFAFPSTKEGFGLAAMEALAAGVPVVVRDLPVLREVFGDAVRYAPDAESLADELAAGLADGRAGHEGDAAPAGRPRPRPPAPLGRRRPRPPRALRPRPGGTPEAIGSVPTRLRHRFRIRNRLPRPPRNGTYCLGETAARRYW